MSADPFKPTYPQALQTARQGARTKYVLSSLWRQRAKWPTGGKRMIFCAEAVDRVGRMKFGAEWKGEFQARGRIYPFPDFRDTLAEFDFALAEFAQRRARQSAGVSNLDPGCPLEEGEKHKGLYESARDKWDRLREENAKSLDRLHWVCHWLAEKGQNGELATFLRLADSSGRGAVYEAAPNGFWNAESVLSTRFQNAGVGGDDGLEYIFFETDSFQRALAEIRIFEAPEIFGDLHLSIFMQLMLRAIEVHGITPENQPKAAYLKQWFKDEWRHERRLDERLFGAMATFVREVERMDGRAMKPPK